MVYRSVVRSVISEYIVCKLFGANFYKTLSFFSSLFV